MQRVSCLLSLAMLLIAASDLMAGGSGYIPPALRGTGYDPSKMVNIPGPMSPMGNLRPWSASAHGSVAVVENRYMHDMISDAIHCSAQTTDQFVSNGDPWTFGTIHIRNCEIGHIWIPRGSGWHSDAIQVTGATITSVRGRPTLRPSLIVENVYIHDTGSGSMTCLVQGSWDTITFRNVQMERCYTDIKVGNARRVII